MHTYWQDLRYGLHVLFKNPVSLIACFVPAMSLPIADFRLSIAG
jgi:hypothetical protein